MDVSGRVLRPVVYHESVFRGFIDPTGADKAIDQFVRIFRPVTLDGNFLVRESADITPFRVIQGGYPQQFQSACGHHSRRAEPSLQFLEFHRIRC
jgi:hypothetical protein